MSEPEQKPVPKPPKPAYVFPSLEGITIRELFAGLAMMGLMDPDKAISLSPADCAAQSVAQADALMAALNIPNPI